MIRHDPAVVKHWRARVRALVKANPAWRAEKKRAGRQHRVYPGAQRILHLLLLGGGWLAVYWSTGESAVAAMGLLLLWTVAVVLGQAAEVATVIFHPGHLWYPFLLPLGEDIVFAEHRLAAVRSSYWSLVEAALCGILLLALSRPVGISGWMALPLFVGVHWAATLSCATLLACWQPRLPYAGGVWVLMVMGIVGVQILGKSPGLVREILPWIETLRVVLPWGWPQAAFLSAHAGSPFALLPLAGMAGGALWVLPRLDRFVRQRFSLERTFEYEERSIDSASTAPVPDMVAAPPAPVPVISPTQVRRALHEALERPPGAALSERGRLDRWVVSTLDVRSRVIVDFMLPGGLSQGRRMLFAAGLIALAFVFRHGGSETGNISMLAVAATAVAAMLAIPLFGGQWGGFSAIARDRAIIAFHAFYPLGFWPIVRAVFLTNIVRIVLALPLFLLATKYCLEPVPLALAHTLDYTFRGVGVAVALQCLVMVFKFSQHSNDTRSTVWFTIVLLGTMTFVAIAGVALVIGLFFIESPATALACSLALVLLFGGLMGFYGWAWGRGCFDVVQMPKL